jgi:hypothetical protein
LPKNIVICSDGTGNTAIKGRGTNVFKLYEAVDVNGHRGNPELTPQLAIYDDGVGNESFKPLKVFAGITGFGLARNVRLLYKSLVRVYDPGDSIFLFGFSRRVYGAGAGGDDFQVRDSGRGEAAHDRGAEPRGARGMAGAPAGLPDANWRVAGD